MVQGAGGTQGYKYIYLYLTNTVIIKFKNANDLAPQAPKLSQSSSRAQSGHPQVPGDAARTALPSFPTQGSWRGRPEVRALGGEIHRQEAGWGGTASKARADSWCDLETVGLRAGVAWPQLGPVCTPRPSTPSRLCLSFSRANLPGCTQPFPAPSISGLARTQKAQAAPVAGPPCWGAGLPQTLENQASVGRAGVCLESLDHSQSFQLPCSALSSRNHSGPGRSQPLAWP